MKPHLIVTLGDPCGIGPELLLKALPAIQNQARLTVVGARAGMELLDQTIPEEALEWIDPTPDIQASHLAIKQPTRVSGLASIEAIRAAAKLMMDGHADALVTLPISKHAAHLAGFHIPGHTEFLRDLTGAKDTRMAFLSPTLNVVLHTVHQSLRSVIEELSAESVAETLTFTANHFPNPERKALRIALCALNPHAGENGAFGCEETILEEALRIAHNRTRAGTGYRSAPCTFLGPFPADTVFLRALKGECDIVTALYHDQGLIPIKVLEPARAVNCTLGLPFIRTSPDHGTAFDIAGQDMADPTNFLSAVEMAIHLAGW